MLKTKIITGLLASSFLAFNISMLPFHEVNFSTVSNYISSSKTAMEEANALILKLEGTHKGLEAKHLSYEKKIDRDNQKISDNEAKIKKLKDEINNLENNGGQTSSTPTPAVPTNKSSKKTTPAMSPSSSTNTPSKPNVTPTKPVINPFVTHNYSIPTSVTNEFNNIKFSVDIYFDSNGNVEKDQYLQLQELYRTTKDYYYWANYWQEKVLTPPSNWTNNEISKAKLLSSKYGKIAITQEVTLTSLINKIKSENSSSGNIPMIFGKYRTQLNNITLTNASNILGENESQSLEQNYKKLIKNVTLDNAERVVQANILKSKIISYASGALYWHVIPNHVNPSANWSIWDLQPADSLVPIYTNKGIASINSLNKILK